MYRTVKVLLVLNLLALSSILARPFVVAPFAAAQSSTKAQDKDNQELVRSMDEDQADRMPPAGDGDGQPLLRLTGPE